MCWESAKGREREREEIGKGEEKRDGAAHKTDNGTRENEERTKTQPT